MLKGHTKIELTDINTGVTEVHEDDNMFTQAIYDKLNNGWTQMVGGLSTLKSWNLPLVTNTLGGIALFSDSIDEDETQTYFPKGNDVLGYAGTIASDGSNKFWGSRNTLESEAYDSETKSVKYVWDFGTSQGNGTIRAIGMMDAKQADFYGRSLYHKNYNARLDVSSYFSGFGHRIVEWNDDTIVWMENLTGQVKINVSRFNLNTITLNNNLATSELVSSKTVALPLSAVNYFGTYWKDGDDGYWYGFLNFQNGFSTPTQTTYNIYYDFYYGSQYLQVIRINKETFGMEYHNITIPTYYVQHGVSNPIITDKYIIMGVSTQSQFPSGGSYGWSYYSKYVRKDVFARISKSDWTVSIDTFKDDSGKQYYMFPNTYDDTTGQYWNYIFGIFMQNIKLPDGTYQMNDMILDDDGLVIEQLKPPINSVTGVPVKSYNESSSMYIMTWWNSLYINPYNSSYGWHAYGATAMVFNKKKCLGLMVGLNNGGYVAYIFPLSCQQLLTINNLSEPVTKTSTQSMKITYTVSDEE